MNLKLKKYLTMVFIALATLCMVLGVLTLNAKTVKADDNYVSPLPDGAYLEDYTVLDVAKEYGTNGTYTLTMSGDKSFKLPLNGASAYTFKFSQTKNPWGIRFAIFNDENGYLRPNNASAYVDLRSGLLDVLPNETVHNKNFTMPTGVTYSMANVYEFGGIRVFNAGGKQIGRLFYLEVNGLRVLEYFFHYEGTDLFTNDYLTVNNVLSVSAGESVVTLTSPEVQDLTGTTHVKFNGLKKDGDAFAPDFTVFSTKTHESTTYTKIIDKQYYDVAYSNVGQEGSATITFKGKYSGSLNATYEYAPPIDGTGAVVTLVATNFIKNADNSPITPKVVAVQKDGKAILESNYDVAYENNVDVGTARAIVIFKNEYTGKAVALFKINSIMTENHFLDENPVVMDLAKVHGGEQKRIEVNENQTNGDVNVGMFFDMNGADVVRFKMTTKKNVWNNYFSLYAKQGLYYVGENGMAYFTLPKASGGRKMNVSVRNGSSQIGSLDTSIPSNVDIGAENGTTVNVELGAIKIFYNDDGEKSYVGRMFYIEFDGVRALEYFYMNDSIEFTGGNFFIGGNTEQIIIEQFDLGGEQNNPLKLQTTVNANNISTSANLADINTESKNSSQVNYFIIITITAVVLCSLVCALLIKKGRKS